MKIIFIGGLFRQDIEDEVNEKSRKMPYFAANNHQWAIINGLEKSNPLDNIILNAMHIRSYPTYKDIFIKSKEWSYNGQTINKDISFLNIFGIKHIWRTVGLIRQLSRLLKQSAEESIVIITYGIHNPFLLAAYTNSKLSKKNIKWCAIVPEIPLFYIGTKGNSKLYNFLKKLDWSISLKVLRSADMFQLLTKNMASLLNIEDRKHIVIEGIMDSNIAIDNKEKLLPEYRGQNIILYTGTTSVEFGILDLLKAFTLIKGKEYKLVICGTGSGDAEIKKYRNRDSRIIWKGFVTREIALKLQREATVLINPRRPDYEFTRYSFPSKTMEYLFSGTPVLMHKLQGIPNEYDEFINWFNSTKEQDIAELITEVCNWSQEKRDKHASEVIDFILNNKTVCRQGKKLYDFIASDFQLK